MLDGILNISQPQNAPELRFEWHMAAKRVYVVRFVGTSERAEPISDDVDSEGKAKMYVLLWLRGYLYRKAALNPDVKVVGSDSVNESHAANG